MAIVQRAGLKRKPTGGKYKVTLSKKKHEIGRAPTLTKLGEQAVKKIRTKGGGEKIRMIEAEYANVLDTKTKKYTKTKIKTVVESPSNRHYIRRNVMTKGSIIETEAGKAKITSRPGQDGNITAVLI